MTKHTVKKDLTKTLNIEKTGDTWTLAKKGSIEVIYDGVDSGPQGENGIYVAETITKSTIVVQGDIDVFGNGKLLGSGNTSGIFVRGDNTKLQVAASSSINGYYGIRFDDSAESVNIRNAGQIHANTGIFTGMATKVAINNLGDIDGNGYGIQVDGEGSKISNSGAIYADTAISMAGIGSQFTNEKHGFVYGTNDGVYASGTNAAAILKIVNKGTVASSEDAIDISQVSAHITNSGRIYGNVRLNDGADVVVNTGRIAGDVLLADGDDIFNTANGRFVGMVYGGKGDDTITLKSASTVYTELVNDGTDTVRIAATYTLVDNIENLVLLGSKAADGTGNGAGNIITGNTANNKLVGLGGTDTLNGGNGKDILDGGVGNDTLTGGGGTDIFIFSIGYNGDTITDFLDGIDKINLNGILGFADLTGKLTQVAGDVHLTLAPNDTLIITGATLANFTEADFLFT